VDRSGEVAIDTPSIVIASAAKQSPVATALISGDGRSPRRFAPRDDELAGIGASAGAASAAPVRAFESARLQWTPQASRIWGVNKGQPKSIEFAFDRVAGGAP
jgi:hypothetical protein